MSSGEAPSWVAIDGSVLRADSAQKSAAIEKMSVMRAPCRRSAREKEHQAEVFPAGERDAACVRRTRRLLSRVSGLARAP